ncbi:MAG: mechanosensitive ion channel family protein [Cellvibrionaceae bacterium]
MENHWLNFEFFTLGSYTLTVGELIFSTLLFSAAIIISKIARRGISRLANLRTAISPSQVYTINRIIHYLILSIGIILAATALGIDLTKLAIVGGALGIGIGLGLQGIVNNFFSGLIIMLDKSLKVGDFIELSDGLVGEVMRINIRSTVVRTNDNVDILIPNSEFVGSRVTNWTLEDNIRRFRIPFSVAYGSDKNTVKKAAIEAANAVPLTLDDKHKAPTVWMTGFGDSSLEFVLAVWVNSDAVKRPSHMMSEYLWAIDDAFRRYKIEIPFPQRDLYFRSGFDSQSKEVD